jgi:hypothetical protein
LECFNPSILKAEPPARHQRSINVVAVLSVIWAAFSRGSGFVLWHQE